MVTAEEHMGRDLIIAIKDNEDLRVDSQENYQIVFGFDNLKQAIINRLRTSVGELPLHPLYGCRLPSMIGTIANDLTLPLAKQYVREALLQEPRIETINKITAVFTTDLKDVIRIEIIVTPIQTNEPLNIIWDLFITGAN